MIFTNKARIALRYLTGHLRHYIFLILSLSFGFAVISTSTSLSDSMSRNVYRAAQQHYGGQLLVLGFHKESGNLGLIQDEEQILSAVKATGIAPRKYIRRTSYFGRGILYFAGNSSLQKNVFGVDWENEKDEFEKLDYSAGSADNLAATNGILISQPVADKLKAQTGDDLTLRVQTKTGQYNTGTFVVKGIFEDRSIFGYYKCFVDITQLNRLLGFEDDEYSTLGLLFDDTETAGRAALNLHSELSEYLPMAPFIVDKEQYSFQLDQN